MSLAALACVPAVLAALAGLAANQTGTDRQAFKLSSNSTWLDTQSGATLRHIMAEAARRPVYPYSVVPGGVRNAVEVGLAVSRDPVVARHYKDFDAARAVSSKLPNARLVHVSYRLNGNVYWTKKKVQLHAGETVLSDGKSEVRGRCGNRISDRPKAPVHDAEPPEVASDTPISPPLTPGEKQNAGASPAGPAAGGEMETPLESVERAMGGFSDRPAGLLSIIPNGMSPFAAGQYRPGLPSQPVAAQPGAAPGSVTPAVPPSSEAGSGSGSAEPGALPSQPGPGSQPVSPQTPALPLPGPGGPGSAGATPPPPPGPNSETSPGDGPEGDPQGGTGGQEPTHSDPPSGPPPAKPIEEWLDDVQKPPAGDDDPILDDPDNWPPQDPSDPGPVEPVPEPGSLAGLAVGAAVIASVIARRKRARAASPFVGH